jgi:hypothetical protein
VRSLDQNNFYSEQSALDFATVMPFADDPIRTPQDPLGGTIIRGQHVSQLRQAVDALRVLAGLSAAWASYVPVTGFVDDAHFLEIRNRLNEARSALGYDPVVFSEAVAAGQPIRRSSVMELRGGVR